MVKKILIYIIINMELEQLLKSSEYKTMKKTYEKEYFKLFGKYCKVSASKGVQEKSVSEMFEKFKNKKVKIEFIEEVQTKKGTTISTKKTYQKASLMFGLKTKLYQNMTILYLNVIKS